jgi:3'-5' exoribonuclease 1
MNYIIYDLEATCWEQWDLNNKTQEIIEIGAIKVNDYGEATHRFMQFIKPKLHPTLSVFCRNLTSIQQQDVDRAEAFERVVDNFKEFCGCFDNEEYVLMSWGNFDKNAMIKDCKLHGLDYDWVAPHINMKEQYQKICHLQRPKGLKNAVESEGFEWEGAHHRGIDDAFNLAKLYVRFRDEWRF